MSETVRAMTARFDGRCLCGAAIKTGEIIYRVQVDALEDELTLCYRCGRLRVDANGARR